MNFTKNIKWQLALAALGVSLFMTGAVRAQEIDNTDFAAPATSVAGNFNTPSAAYANAAVNKVQAQIVAVSESSVVPVNEQEQASLASFPRALGYLTAIGVVLMACGILWKNAGNRPIDTLRIQNSLSMRKNQLPNRKAQALRS